MAAAIEGGGLRLSVELLNVPGRRWLDEIANARVHGTTKAVPSIRLADERAVMLPAPALKAPPPGPTRLPLPVECFLHPLAVSFALFVLFS